MHVPVQEGAYVLQNKASVVLKNEALKRIEKVFNEFDTGGKTIRIEKLELDLTDEEFADMDDILAAHIEEKLREELGKLLHEESIFVVTGERGISAQQSGIKTVDTRQNETELVLFFLEKGYLPWWADNKTASIAQSLEQLVSTGDTNSFYRYLVPLLELKQSRTRLVNLLPESYVQQIIYDLLKTQPALVAFMRALWEATPGRQPVYAHALHACALPGINIQTWISFFFEQHAQFNTAQTLLEKLDLQRKKIVIEALVKTTGFNKSELVELLSPYKGKIDIVKDDIAIEKLLKEKPEPVDAKKEKQSNYKTEIDSIYIEQAGLVLIHAYLQPFFAALGLLNGRTFKTEEAQHLAVHILHYMASGTSEMPEEHQLVLPKLLCGLEPEDVLVTEIELTHEQKHECEQLLQAVIDNWGALKRSSPAGLRQAFINREGKLARKTGGWNLHIERTAIDILLDKLPWGISLIKLPWYDEIIYVEW